MPKSQNAKQPKTERPRMVVNRQILQFEKTVFLLEGKVVAGEKKLGDFAFVMIW